MAKPKIGIITLHGLGTHGPDFDSELKENLVKAELLLKYNVEFCSLNYHQPFQDIQTAAWERLSQEPMSMEIMRKFLLLFFGDAVVYEDSKEEANSIYYLVSEYIKNHIDALLTIIGEDAPIVVIAQSLGCQVISNYIWDVQHNKGIWKDRTPSNAQKLTNLKILFTSGCNIPMFVAGKGKIETFNRPNADFKWFNYYDKDDILGWPLKPLNKPEDNWDNSYTKMVNEDIVVRTGLPLISHLNYWKDSGFYKDVAGKIKDLYNSLPG